MLEAVAEALKECLMTNYILALLTLTCMSIKAKDFESLPRHKKCSEEEINTTNATMIYIEDCFNINSSNERKTCIKTIEEYFHYPKSDSHYYFDNCFDKYRSIDDSNIHLLKQ